MADSKQKSYLHGAAILTAAVAVVKVIGFLYKIPLYNILGTENTSTFTVAYTIYTLLLTISTAGLPVALSKMISAADAMGRPRQVKRIFSVGLAAFTVCGLLSFLIMFFFPRELAALMNNADAWYSIMALAPAVLFICLISAYRGYAQGFSDMIPTSVSQIVEALCKLVFGLSLAWLLVRMGYSMSIASAGAIAGVSIGTALACLYLVVYKRRMDRKMPAMSAPDVPDSRKKILDQLLRIGVPITLGASILSIVNVVDTSLILGRLQSAAGFSFAEAKALHGTYSMAVTLFNLPASFVTPITVSLIPAISAYIARGEHKMAAETASSGIKMTCLLAMPAGAGLFALSAPIMNVLYSDSTAEGPGILAALGLASFFVCLVLVTNCILQAYGFQRYTLYTLPIGSVIKIVVNWVLVGNPHVHIYGAAVGTLACYVAISVMNIFLIKKRIPHPPHILRVLIRPAVCTVVMGAAAWSFYSLIRRFLSSAITGGIWKFQADWLGMAISMISAVLIACVVYLILAVALRALTYRDMKMLPKGDKLARLLRIR